MKVAVETHYRIMVLLKFDLKLKLLIQAVGRRETCLRKGLVLGWGSSSDPQHGLTELKQSQARHELKPGIMYLLGMSDARG